MNACRHRRAAESSEGELSSPALPYSTEQRTTTAACEVGLHERSEVKSSLDFISRCKTLEFRIVYRMLYRRLDDVRGVSLMVLFVGTCHWYCARVLLTSIETTFTVCAALVYYVLLLLMFLSWMGTVLVGPGSALEAEQVKLLDPALLQALDVGRFCIHKPFAGSSIWCTACEKRKHPLSSHCRTCDTCTAWMSAHCPYTACCVGFQNARCYVAFLGYASAVLLVFLALALRHFIFNPAPSKALLGMQATCCCLMLIYLGVFVYMAAADIMYNLAAGWSHSVLREKHEELMNVVLAVELELLRPRALNDMDLNEAYRQRAKEAIKDLRNARAALLWPSGETGMRGPFAQPPLPSSNQLGSALLRLRLVDLQRVFGEPPSWRWFLPLVGHGGIGSALRPPIDVPMCEAWVAFGEVVEKTCELIIEQLDEQNQWVKRLLVYSQEDATQRAQSTRQLSDLLGPSFPSQLVEHAGCAYA